LQRILRPLPLTDESPASEVPHGVISGVAFSPSGREVTVGCGDGTIAVCSLKPPAIRSLLSSSPVRIWGLAFSPDGRMLASAAGEWFGSNGEGEVKIWDVRSGRVRATLKDDGQDMFSLAFSPNGRTLAAGGRDEVLRLWDVASGRLTRCEGHHGLVRSVAFHPDGRTVVSAAFDATIRFWDPKTGQESREAIDLKGNSPNCVAISCDGKTLAANTAREEAEEADEGSDEKEAGPPIAAPGVIHLWDWDTGKERMSLRGCEYQILALALSPDGRLMASGGGVFREAGEVKLWDIAEGKLIADLKGHSDWVEWVAFSPDGKTLVSAGGSPDRPGEIKLWDLKSSPAGDSPRSR
jgi:WD40 repeat protein